MSKGGGGGALFFFNKLLFILENSQLHLVFVAPPVEM